MSEGGTTDARQATPDLLQVSASHSLPQLVQRRHVRGQRLPIAQFRRPVAALGVEEIEGEAAQIRLSLDHLPAHGHVQLGCRRQIRSDQVHVIQLHGAIVALSVQKIKQGGSAVLIGK